MSLSFITGTFQLTATFLSVIAGLIALSLFHHSYKHDDSGPWKYMIVALVLFAVEEVLGALVSFKVMQPTFMTHFLPGAIVAFVIVAVVSQIHMILVDSAKASQKRQKR